MKLSECKYGVLVEDSSGNVGMVLGISQNEAGEAVPLVQWQSNTAVIKCHPKRIALYEE